MMELLLLLIPLFPLLGFLLLGTGFRKLSPKVASVVGPATVIISFLLSLVLFIRMDNQTSLEVTLFQWITSGNLQISFSFLLDPLSALMLLVITGVGSVIHFYSIGYMHDDPGYNRFFSYMNLFVFSMLILVLGASFPVMFIGWEGVGLCSYLLIGFWFRNQEFNNAAKKAFIMNRIGDLGFLLGMFLIFTTFGSLSYKDVFSQAGMLTSGTPVIIAITLLLFVGAVGKSAQIPLYTWLPDAMAGPTPVSALIHAATMVTAGVYLVARSNILFAMAPLTMEIITITGLATALFAAVIAIFQNDIKKILAYSTISQLGYMFVGLGTGAFTAAMFHLTTHAFFKALLFLTAGSVIHALGGEQDIRKMGGLKDRTRLTFWLFSVGVFAISGFPFFSGFYSKDQILASAFNFSPVIWILAAGGALMTAYYMFRLFNLTFLGKYRGSVNHIHESPKVMIIPLAILAILSFAGGQLNIPELFGGDSRMEKWLQPVFSGGIKMMGHAEGMDHSTEWIITALVFAGILVMMWLAFKNFAKKEVSFRSVRLISNKFYVDEIYDWIIVKPLNWFSDIFERYIERGMIDGTVNGLGSLTLRIGSWIRYLQTGHVGFYLFVMVFSIIGILIYNILLK